MTIKEAIVKKLDSKLIPEWRKARRMLSIKWGAFCLVALPVWEALSDDQRASLLSVLGIAPGWYVAAGVAVGIYLRLKNQPELRALIAAEKEGGDAEHPEP